MAELLNRPLILGSASPRRADLLTSLGLVFQVRPVDIDEAAFVAPSADDVANVAASVEQIAAAKFRAAGPADESPTPWLLTADTLVACGNRVLGKPDNDKHLAEMLVAMSGNVLTIVTAVCLAEQGSQPTPLVVTTRVELRPLDKLEIDAYIATGAGLDKAAGLALQSEAKHFISTVNGCWSNVVGLPVCAVTAELNLAPTGRSQPARCSIDLCGIRPR